MVTKNGVPLAEVQLVAHNQSANLDISTNSATDGTFNFGIIAGDWSITLENNSASQANLVGPKLEYSVADNTTISNIPYPVISGTATISLAGHATAYFRLAVTLP